jgi:hypothetical protein
MRALTWLLALLLAFGIADVHATDGEPVPVTPCQLMSDPARFDHTLVQVYGFVSHGFEQFTMQAGTCPIHEGMSTGLWLEYGGKHESETVYCCTNASGADRDDPLVVEDVRTDLVDDALFKQFDRALRRRDKSTVVATIVGRFFAGRGPQSGGDRFWGGYGHMGCCSLLVVEQVLSVKPTTYEPYAKTSPPAPTMPLPPVDARLLSPKE